MNFIKRLSGLIIVLIMNFQGSCQDDSTALTPFGTNSEIYTIIMYDTADFVVMSEDLFCLTRPLVETTIFKLDLTTFYAQKYNQTRTLWETEKQRHALTKEEKNLYVSLLNECDKQTSTTIGLLQETEKKYRKAVKRNKFKNKLLWVVAGVSFSTGVILVK